MYYYDNTAQSSTDLMIQPSIQQQPQLQFTSIPTTTIMPQTVNLQTQVVQVPQMNTLPPYQQLLVTINLPIQYQVQPPIQPQQVQLRAISAPPSMVYNQHAVPPRPLIEQSPALQYEPQIAAQPLGNRQRQYQQTRRVSGRRVQIDDDQEDHRPNRVPHVSSPVPVRPRTNHQTWGRREHDRDNDNVF